MMHVYLYNFSIGISVLHCQLLVTIDAHIKVSVASVQHLHQDPSRPAEAKPQGQMSTQVNGLITWVFFRITSKASVSIISSRRSGGGEFEDCKNQEDTISSMLPAR